MRGGRRVAAGAALLLLPVTLAAASPERSRKPRRERTTATPRRQPPPPAAPAPRAVPRAPVPSPEGPLGFTRRLPRALPPEEMVPVPDRWRIGLPEYDRYPGSGAERPFVRGRWWNPYDLNVLKGDYPAFGRDRFVALTLRSDTLVEGRRLPTPSGVSTARPGSTAFLGRGESLLVEQLFVVSAEVFRGAAGFKPRDWELRATPVFAVNHLATRETGVVDVDVRHGTDRLDGHVGLQELFGDLKLADVSPAYDTVNLRAGIQSVVSDFRGFLFVDSAPGLRLAGTAAANRVQWTVAWFRPLEKDTNSGLNTVFRDRDQDVALATVLRQDTLWPGYTAQASLHYDGDHGGRHFDDNGVPVRPANVGDARPHELNVGWVGWTGDGHIQRVGVSHAVYAAFGRDDHDPIAGRAVDVRAQLAALELSYDRDWLRLKASALWASGDADPTDGTARGFDAIVDNPSFAGGPFSFWQRQGIRLVGTGVALVNRASFLPTLRSSKEEGQASFVNPGLVLVNAGVSSRLTPKLVAELNASWLRFHEPAPIRLLQLQEGIRHDIGIDLGLGLVYRPLLIDNVRLVAGAATLLPLAGFRDLYGGETLWQLFGAGTLTF